MSKAIYASDEDFRTREEKFSLPQVQEQKSQAAGDRLSGGDVQKKLTAADPARISPKTSRRILF
jgi:hypothetical protein